MNISNGRFLQPEEIGVTIYNQIIQVNNNHKNLHISFLEMEAMILSIKHFQNQVQNGMVFDQMQQHNYSNTSNNKGEPDIPVFIVKHESCRTG